jgi:predicted RNase H-like nuclease (RuvC/YqgF family)
MTIDLKEVARTLESLEEDRKSLSQRVGELLDENRALTKETARIDEAEARAAEAEQALAAERARARAAEAEARKQKAENARLAARLHKLESVTAAIETRDAAEREIKSFLGD